MELEIDRQIGAASPDCAGEKGTKLKCNALNLFVALCSNPHLWSRTGLRPKDTGLGQNEFPP